MNPKQPDPISTAIPGRHPVTADDPGYEDEDPGRQRQRGTLEKHEKPLVV
jgi:hypothetical protein